MGEVKMTVNVSLCGSVPRSQMGCRGVQLKRSTLNESLPLLANEIGCKAACGEQTTGEPPIKKPRRVSNDYLSIIPPSQVAPPSWAVPARGEARLEPICSGLYHQSPVDLNAKACIRFGRSQSSDVQLLHDTSSRRHAILFHHPNGSCYVIDCGSAHGTYVNGVRVNSSVKYTNADINSPSRATAVPHRVKKGSLIRFGGVGAPSYILKSFSVSLASLVKDSEIAKVSTCSSNVIEDDPPFSTQYIPACYDKSNDVCADSLLTVNTRLNAMGNTSMQTASRRCLPALVRARLGSHSMKTKLTTPFLKKRSMSVVPRCVSDENVNQMHKKMRPSLTLFPLSREDVTEVGLISPSRSTQKPFTIEVQESDRPVVSPNPSNDNDNLEIDSSVKSSMIVPLSLSLERKVKKCVKFSTNPPEYHQFKD